MKSSARLWSAIAVLVAVGLYVRVGGAVALAAAVAACAALSVPFGARLSPGIGWQRVLTALAAALGAAAGMYLIARPTAHVVRNTIEPLWSAVAMTGLFAAGARLFVRSPEGGPFATMGCALLALVACGETRERGLYVPACIAFVVCAAFAVRAGDPARAAVKLPVRARDIAVAAAVVLVAIGFAALNGAVLPALADRADRFAGLDDIARTGFTDQLGLGSIDQMLESDEVVMRVVNGRADYLRGAIYDTYSAGQWRGAEGGALRTLQIASSPARNDSVQIVVTGGDVHHYFVPLGAAHVATADGAVQVDRYGIARTASTARVVWFDRAPAQDFPVLAPTPRDLAIPDDLRATLTRLVTAWTAPSMSPRERALAIERHLRTEYRYSLHFHRRGRNPLEEFLTDDRQGHCEYFASALALLLRTASIPARVAAGYRVHEENPLDGHFVVRERDAHAWVEAFLPDRGWQTLDATPAAGGVASNTPRMGWIRAIGDSIATWFARARAANAMPLWITLGALVLAFIAYREVRSRLEDARRRKKPGSDPFANEPSPPELDRFLAALAARGVARARSETLEAYARRLRERDLTAASEALAAYAAHRYGGEGDRVHVLRALASWDATDPR